MNETSEVMLPTYSGQVASLRGWIICGVAALFYCYEFLLRIQPSVMVNELMQQFHITANKFGLIVSLYYAAYTPMQIVVGVMTDLYGPRRILTLATIICALGTWLFAIADNIYLAGFARFVIGFGSAFGFVSVLKLASIWLPLNRFAMFAGLTTALGMTGGMFGDIGMTALVNSIGWQHTLFWSAIAGLILTPVIALVIRDGKGRLSNNEKISYRDTFSNVFRIMRDPQMWIVGLVGCILYMSLSVFAELWAIPYLQQAHHLTPHQSAFATSAVFLGWLVGAPVTGWISDKLQKRRLPLMLGCWLAAGVIVFVLYFSQTNLALIEICLFLFGVFCSIEVVCFAMGREMSPYQFSGAAIAFVNLLVMLGGMLFQPIVGHILDKTWIGVEQGGFRVYTAHNYQIALAILPIALVLGGLLTLTLKETFQVSREVTSHE